MLANLLYSLWLLLSSDDRRKENKFIEKAI